MLLVYEEYIREDKDKTELCPLQPVRQRDITLILVLAIL